MSIEPTCDYCHQCTKFRCKSAEDAEKCAEETRMEVFKNIRHKHIFVFGSNLGGRHGKGAALFARDNYGAVYGEGAGRTGNAYGIPTKDVNLKILSLDMIETHVKVFNMYTFDHPNLIFLVTPFGTGLAGYNKLDIIAIMQKLVWTRNVLFTKEWMNL